MCAKKRATSFDVAKKAGVSRSLVSAVINNTPGIGVSKENREAIMQAIAELNYHVDAGARSMKTGLSRCIAAYGSLSNPLFSYMLEGMQKACAAAGYHILVSGHIEGQQDRFDLLTLYFQRRIDGIVTLDNTSYQDPKWASEVRTAGIPYVSVEGYAEQKEVPSVLVDYARSIQDALEHMAMLGGRAPHYWEAYQTEPGANWAERQRRSAYEEWCRSRGMEPVVKALYSNGDDMGHVLGLLREYQSEGEFPPILINWSYSVVPIYRAALELGLTIGKDLRIMAADNTVRGNRLLAPALTCMDIPYAQMGRQAVTAVLEQIESGRTTPAELRQVWVSAQVLEGHSF